MKISTVLDHIDSGHMALPEFQRSYVWNRDQVPVAVLLNEDAATIRIASEAGFRYFSDTKSFKRYVKIEVLGEAPHA
jgi:hypothetical protein